MDTFDSLVNDARMREELYKLKAVRKLGSFDVALRLGTDIATVDKIYKEEKAKREVQQLYSFFSPGNTGTISLETKEDPEEVDTKPITISADSALVMSDFHCPHYNKEMLERAITICQKYFPKVKTAIIPGDLFDFESLSVFPHTNPSAPDTSKTLLAGGTVLEFVSTYYDTYLTSGNHDERFAKKLNSPYHLRHIVSAALDGRKTKHKITTTNMDYLYLGDKWVIGHPSHYSIIGGKTPAEIAAIEEKNCATGHNHIIGIQTSKNGKYLGVDLGHMTDPSSHYYMTRRLTKFPRWLPGFLVIEDGFAYPFWDDRHTNWNKWL